MEDALDGILIALLADGDRGALTDPQFLADLLEARGERDEAVGLLEGLLRIAAVVLGIQVGADLAVKLGTLGVVGVVGGPGIAIGQQGGQVRGPLPVELVVLLEGGVLRVEAARVEDGRAGEHRRDSNDSQREADPVAPDHVNHSNRLVQD